MPSKRKGVMLAKKLNDLYYNRLPDKIFVQPKINGMRCRAKLLKGDVWLFSSQGNVINSVPHINEAIFKIIPDTPNFQFDGELFVKGMPLEKIGSICRKTTRLDADYKQMEYHIFDTVTEQSQEKRFHWLIINDDNFKDPLFGLETPFIDKEDWQFYYVSYLKEGYEGIILRNPFAYYQPKRTSDLLKRKKVYTGHYKILGAFEAISLEGELKGMLGGLCLIDKNKERFNCGAGCLSHGERIKVWKQFLLNQSHLLPQEAEIDYPELTERGVPHQPILRRIVE